MNDRALTMEHTADEASIASAADFLALLKPRVMSLVVFTALVGLLLAPGEIHPVIAFTAIMCIAVGAGASGCLNMWYDADIDARMRRTRGRPVPAGRISRGEALGFGATLSVASVVMMGLVVNLVAAGLLALTIAYYLFIYTMWLKRRTPQNIVIGGAAGAFPPMIGWAAVTGSVSVESLILFAIIFFWTPPHFWALSLFISDDYKAAGVPMLPVVAGPLETRRQIFFYSLLLAPLGVAPFAIGMSGLLYGIGAALLGVAFLALAARVWRRGETMDARRLFLFSIVYLAALFLLLPLDKALS
ncbi:MAG: protoheme IX farnesyltransferase [Proteobacteria bacterium]|jgi:protoheme IX farnesyltransferase|nr:MAG: protoheme IX farnesyltransferase [Pseudomonadota bacterium]